MLPNAIQRGEVVRAKAKTKKPQNGWTCRQVFSPPEWVNSEPE